MPVRVGINGFGRIGRNIMRAALGDKNIDFVAINDLTSAHTLAHLLKYDSVLGNLHAKVEAKEDSIAVDGDEFKVLQHRDPAQLPWKDLGVDVVFESTGLFTNRDAAAKHLAAGAKKVVITAPAKGPDFSVVLGVNDELYDPARHHIISNASCTTNCLAPLAKVLHQTFGIKKGWMTTIHSYNQRPAAARPAAQGSAPGARRRTLDDSDHDRRGGGGRRSAGPSSRGKLDGISMRVPTPNVSCVDLAAVMNRTVTAEEVNAALQKAADGPLKGILACSYEELVSIDFKGNPHSSIVDMPYTKVMEGDFLKILSWYDNEWGYSNRCVDLLRKLVAKGL